MKSPVDVFDDWARKDKDKGMETGHRQSVDAMLEFALNKFTQPFRFIDAGCGNGWVKRLVEKHPLCKHAQGVDGASEMINKARAIDPHGQYEKADLLQWKPSQPANLVHAMEVAYYFSKPAHLIQHITNNWLIPGGRLIIGIDHYLENTPSLNWAEECGISIMTTLPKSSWQQIFIDADLIDVESWQVGQKDDWQGTLIVTGVKPVSHD